jgi:4-amino-4-deoxy-L-arabinose transferase-like glycosyltransferase
MTISRSHLRGASHLRVSWRTLAESLAVAVSPVAAFFGLRIRLMPLPDLNDPAMHTTFIIDPQSIFLRYMATFTPSARLREGARVAFLVPGRIAYLLFGVLPGFVVFRYVLALVALVPAYLLLRRLYGRPAGAVAAIVILSSPVVITAWGTDFPNSAAISYLIAAMACLAMPAARRRTAWIAASAVFFTLSFWSIATTAPLIVATLAVYALVRFQRDRARMFRDAVVMAIAALAVTVVLGIASGVFLGQFDYITPTIGSLLYLGHKSIEALYHSSNWRWAPYVAYLLVPPAILGLWLIAFGRRITSVGTAQLIIGLACAAQLLVSVLLQFVGKVQILEEDYFSSLLWAGFSLLLAITLVQLGRPMLDHHRFAWLLPALLVVVPLAYELDPNVPPFGWLPVGVVMVAAVLVIGVIAARLRRLAPTRPARVATGVVVALAAAGLLVVTVAPIPIHPMLPGTVFDPAPAYAAALGGGDTRAVNLYIVTADIPRFVGPATYSGEQLLIWWPRDEQQQILGPIGIYHAFYDSVPGDLGELSAPGRQLIEQRQAAQILLMSFTGQDFAQSLTALSPFQPTLVRSGVLRSGSVALHLWLIDLGKYFRGRT